MLLNYIGAAINIVFSCASAPVRNNFFWQSGDLKLTLLCHVLGRINAIYESIIDILPQVKQPMFLCAIVFKRETVFVRENEETRDCDRRADIKWKNTVPNIYLYTEANKLFNRSWKSRGCYLELFGRLEYSRQWKVLRRKLAAWKFKTRTSVNENLQLLSNEFTEKCRFWKARKKRIK